MNKNKFIIWNKLFKNNKKNILLSAFFSALSSILLIIPFILIFKIIKYFLNFGIQANISPIINLFIIAIFLLILRYIFTIFSFLFAHFAAFDLTYKTRVDLAKHIGNLPIGFFSKNNSGKILKIMNDDVESIEHFIGHQIPDLVASFTLPIITLLYLFYLNWSLGIMTFIPFLLIIILFNLATKGFLFGQNRKQIIQKYHKSMEKMNSSILEFVGGMPIIKIFNVTTSSFKKLKNSILEYKNMIILFQKGATPYRALIGAIALGGGIFILPLGIFLLKNSKISILTLIFFLLLGTGCFLEILKAIMIWTRMELILVGMKKIENIFNFEILKEPENPIFPNKNNISIQNLNFKYEENGENVLKNINIEIPKNSFVAFVGNSGSGKTTLINLIARMWEVKEGKILIDNIDLKNIGTKGITKTVGTVFQEVQILTDTIENNIKMGNNNFSRENIISAAKTAACHDFIEKLPNGYDTIIGEGGDIHLSGGEKQRIALARVILKNTSIVLLDEATSYADAEVETKIQNAFSTLAQNKTIIVIAHRLSTIVGADKIFVFDDGKIVESGKHNELLQQKGFYEKMRNSRIKARNWTITK